MEENQLRHQCLQTVPLFIRDHCTFSDHCTSIASSVNSFCTLLHCALLRRIQDIKEPYNFWLLSSPTYPYCHESQLSINFTPVRKDLGKTETLNQSMQSTNNFISINVCSQCSLDKAQPKDL